MRCGAFRIKIVYTKSLVHWNSINIGSWKTWCTEVRRRYKGRATLADKLQTSGWIALRLSFGTRCVYGQSFFLTPNKIYYTIHDPAIRCCLLFLQMPKTLNRRAGWIRRHTSLHSHLDENNWGRSNERRTCTFVRPKKGQPQDVYLERKRNDEQIATHGNWGEEKKITVSLAMIANNFEQFAAVQPLLHKTHIPLFILPDCSADGRLQVFGLSLGFLLQFFDTGTLSYLGLYLFV